MNNTEKSRDSLSDLERLFPQTLARVPALQRQAALSSFIKEYRQQAPIFVVGTLGLTLLAIAGVAVGKLTPFAAIVPILLAVGVVLGVGFSSLAVWVLFSSVMLERLSFFLLSSDKLNVRIDEIFAVAVALGLGVRLMQQHNLMKQLGRVPGVVPLVIFFIFNVFTTLFSHHHLQKGLIFLSIMFAGILLYISLALLVSETNRAERVSDVILSIGSLENLFGLGAFCVAYYFWLPGIFGLQIEPSSGLLEATGSMFEGNIFGHFSGAILVFIFGLALSLAFYGRLPIRRSLLLLVAGGVSLLTLLVTFSRGGWLSAVISSIVVIGFTLSASDSRALTQTRQRVSYIILGSKEHIQQRRIRTVIATILFAIIGLAIIRGGAHTTIGVRVADAFQTQSGTGVARVQNTQVALTEWQQDPILGVGDGSIDQPLDAAQFAPPWILSMGVGILHDSGIIGAILFVWFLWVVYRQLWLSARRASNAELQGLIIGTTGAVSCILIGAQFTNSMYLMLPWAFLGFAGAMPLLTRRSNMLVDAPKLSPDT